MFQPPRCPYPGCSQFTHPRPRFYHRHGFYTARCRAGPIPRFRCKTCRRTFSRQSFRMDYCDHRPDLNRKLFELVTSGVGLRQCSRILGLSRRCLELKARKIGRHLRRLNVNLLGPLPPGSMLQLDELETYEGRRNTRPLSVPVLIESSSRLLIWAESAPIRPSGRMTPARRAAIAEDELRFGPRRDTSHRSVRRTFERGAQLTGDLARIILITDEKPSYVPLARRIFGAGRLAHGRTNSKLPRTTCNPLFPINHTEAMARDLMGRLRRESWLVSKRRRYLDIALHVFIAYRNFVRRRYNWDERSPAQVLGLLPRRLSPGEILSWRQDGSRLSIHPLARRAESVEQWQTRSRLAA